MTKGLKELLHKYGVLTMSLSQLHKERPGSEYKNLEEYYRSLGPILPDEPILVVKISEDGETRMDADEARTFTWELPEDEFWYFRAFRPALFDLSINLPQFAYEMGVTYAYSLFEGYLSEILSSQFRRHPKLMGSKRQITYEQLFDAPTKENLVEQLVDREVRDLMYLPVPAILKTMRYKLGLRSLSDQYDEQLNHISLIRNCILHNLGRVDSKLADAQKSFKIGDTISLSIQDLDRAVFVLRKLAYQIDCAYEKSEDPGQPQAVKL